MTDKQAKGYAYLAMKSAGMDSEIIADILEYMDGEMMFRSEEKAEEELRNWEVDCYG